MSDYNKLLKVRLTIHKPSQSQRLKEVNQIVNDQTNASSEAIRASINIFQKGDVARFNAVVSQARVWFTDNSLAWDEKSWRAIPANKWGEFSSKMIAFANKAEETFQEDVLDNYDQLKRNFEFSKGTLDTFFPEKEDFAGAFGVDVSCEPVSTDTNGLILSGLKEEIVKDVQSRLRKQNDENLSKGLQSLSYKIAGLLEDLKIRLGQDQKGKSYKKLFANIQDYSTVGSDLNIANNTSLIDALSLISVDVLWFNPDVLKTDTVAREGMLLNLDVIIELLRKVR